MKRKLIVSVVAGLIILAGFGEVAALLSAEPVLTEMGITGRVQQETMPVGVAYEPSLKPNSPVNSGSGAGSHTDGNSWGG